MKKIGITALLIIFSISFCTAQNIKEEADRQKQIEQQRIEQQKEKARQQKAAEEQQRREEQQRQAMEEQRQQELELHYNNFIESAQRNFNMQQYEQSKQNYKDALELKPENAVLINPKIVEIDGLLLNEQYKETIASAQRNFEQKKYAQAKQDYTTAMELKPENAAFINSQIAEIDRLLAIEEQQRVEAERERRYQETIASAQKNFRQKVYSQAKADYRTALNIKPENAAYINSQIAEVDRAIADAQQAQKKAERKVKAKKVWGTIGAVAVLVVVVLVAGSASGGGGN